MSIGSHGSTYGGNPLAMAVAEEVLNMVVEPGLLDHVNRISAYAREKFKPLLSEFPDLVQELRGKGLMFGLKLSEDYDDVRRLLLAEGLISVGAGKDVIRFVPPLIVTEKEFDEAFDMTRRALLARRREKSA